MGNSFRNHPSPTLYAERKTPVTIDDQQVELIVAFAVIAFCFLLIIPGIRGWERLWATIRVFVALWIGAVIVTSNFSSWKTDKICSRMPYKSFVGYLKNGRYNHPDTGKSGSNSPQLIQAEVGLSIGLHGINITLLETACSGEGTNAALHYEQNRPFPNETINYNERFSWDKPWGQGRRDFGIRGSSFNQAYRAAKYRGLPYPIMWVAEAFTLDGEQILWYRKFCLAGWYTHVLLWTAFATYLLSIILFIWNIWYGAKFMLITGALMLLAVLSYCLIIMNDPPLKIHFGDATLKPELSWAFYLTVITGTFTMISGMFIMYMDFMWPRKTADFFHHSFIQDDTMFEIDEDLNFQSNLDEFGVIGKKGSRISNKGSGRGKPLQRRHTSRSTRRNPTDDSTEERRSSRRLAFRHGTSKLSIHIQECPQAIQLKEVECNLDS